MKGSTTILFAHEVKHQKAQFVCIIIKNFIGQICLNEMFSILWSMESTIVNLILSTTVPVNSSFGGLFEACYSILQSNIYKKIINFWLTTLFIWKNFVRYYLIIHTEQHLLGKPLFQINHSKSKKHFLQPVPLKEIF